MIDYWSTRDRWWPAPSRSGNGMGKSPKRPFVLVALPLPGSQTEGE